MDCWSPQRSPCINCHSKLELPGTQVNKLQAYRVTAMQEFKHSNKVIILNCCYDEVRADMP